MREMGDLAPGKLFLFACLFGGGSILEAQLCQSRF